MLTIYAIPLSLYCAKLRILLRHKNLEWQELPPPGGYGSDDYKKIIPSGNLPALIHGDLQLADSEAIAEYLNETYPDPAMLPDEARARARTRERSRFHDTRLEPALRKLFGNITPDKQDADLNARQSVEINARLAQLGVMLENQGSDDFLTLGDCGFAVTFSWIDALAPVLDLTVSWPDAVKSWRDKIEAHAAVKAELEDYRPKLQAWLTA
jgi:glutathione S-transferase